MFARLLLPCLLVCAFSLESAAQTIPFQLPAANPLKGGKQGQILVKLTLDQFNRGVTPEIFGEPGRRYGIYNVEPWLNPTLVAYRPHVAYKMNGAGVGELPGLGLRRIMLVEYSALDAPEEVALALERFSGVEYADPIYTRELLYTPNDPDLNQQWYLDSIHAKQAWDLVRMASDDTITIAIVDNGFEHFHPDLEYAVWYNPNETGLDNLGNDKFSNGIDDDLNGFVDDWWGYDFAGSDGSVPDNNPAGAEDNHGTVVAGIAAASGDNGHGIAGVAFGARLMAVKVVDDLPAGRSGLFREIEGVLYAARMGADVINCSWGGRGSYRAEQEVIDEVTGYHGAIVVSAAGNKSQEVDFYPASYRGVLSVASISEGNAKPDFSNYGHRVDLSAPGTSIYSTIFTSQGSYAYDPSGGTSFSAPMVSGAAALVRKHYPNLAADQIREIITASTDDIRLELGGAYAEKMGSGRLNIRRAVELGPSQISARMVSHALIDESSNGVVEAGENVRLRADVKNLLAPATDVTVTVTPVSHPALQIQIPTVNLGAMTMSEIKETPHGSILFTVPANLPENSEIILKVSVTTAGRTNTTFITFRVSPTFLTTDLNDITATFNSIGNIGYNGIKPGAGSEYRGDGFVFDGIDYIYHGGLIVATDASHVSDVVRRGPSIEGTENGFRTMQPYRLEIAGDSALQIGTALFNDSHRPAELRVGVEVEMKTYEYLNLPNVVIVAYRIRNNSSVPITGMRAGLYLDWDVSDGGGEDQTGYFADMKLAYGRAPHDPHRAYVGTALLSDQDASFYAVDNNQDGTTTAFTPELKWTMLSSGVHENSAITDIGIVLGAGTISLDPNQETLVVFGLMTAADSEGLRETTLRARQILQPGSAGEPPPAGTFRSSIAPNPFGNHTLLSFTMPQPGPARLTVHDMQGRHVATLFDGTLDAGTHAIPFTPQGLPEGIYIYEIHAAGLTERGKIVKLTIYD